MVPKSECGSFQNISFDQWSLFRFPSCTQHCFFYFRPSLHLSITIFKHFLVQNWMFLPFLTGCFLTKMCEVLLKNVWGGKIMSCFSCLSIKVYGDRNAEFPPKSRLCTFLSARTLGYEQGPLKTVRFCNYEYANLFFTSIFMFTSSGLTISLSISILCSALKLAFRLCDGVKRL